MIHLLVVPVFQELWFISGIIDLVTVEFRRNDKRIGRSTLSDARALVGEVTDTDRRSAVGNTAEMCDLKCTTEQYFFQSRCSAIRSVFCVAAKFLKRVEIYKNGNISTLHHDVKNRRVAAPRVFDLMTTGIVSLKMRIFAFRYKQVLEWAKQQ